MWIAFREKKKLNIFSSNNGVLRVEEIFILWRMIEMSNKDVKRKEWIIGGVIFISLFLLYLYSDICHTTTRGITLWRALFEGKIGEFYVYPYPGVEGSWMPNGTQGGAYDFVLYIIFALWDLPLYCFEQLTGISFLSTYGTRLYAKGIVLLFTFLSAFALKKLIFKLTNKREKAYWGMFLFFSSIFMVNSITIMGAYDIISVFFTLVGICFYFEKDEWKYLLFFALAITCKMFAIFIFIPLVLLRYKKIWEVILRGFAGISLIVIPKLFSGLWNFIAKYIVSSQDNKEIVSNRVIAHSDIINEQMFAGNGAVLTLSYLPLFFFFTLALWWFCWKKKNATDYDVIYICTLSMSIFSLCVRMHPYWIVLLAPYVVIIIILNMERICDNIILELIFSLCYTIFCAYNYYWCYSFNLFNKMFGLYSDYNMEYQYCLVLRIIDNLSEVIGISSINIISIFTCGFAVGLIMFLFDNRPGQQVECSVDYKRLRQLVWVRALFGIGVAMIPMVAGALCL